MMMLSAAAAAVTPIRCVVRRRIRYLSTSTNPTTTSRHHDVVIVGGGVVGCTLANLLQRKCPTWTVALLERTKGPVINTGSSTPSDNSSVPHPRSYALSPSSLNLLGDSITSKLNVGTYDTMQIWEQESPGMLVFSQHDLAEGEEFLGACVEDAPLVSALWETLETSSVYTETRVESMDIRSGREVQIQTNDDETFSASLLIAADGANSSVREQLGMPWYGLDYGRAAMTCTVQLDKKMPTRAFQRFLSNGPIALLPTRSKDHAVVVWSTTPEHAEELKRMPSADLVQNINRVLQVGPQRVPRLFETGSHSSPSLFNNLLYGVEQVANVVHYGLAMRHWNDDPEVFLAPPTVKEVASPKFTFPLGCKYAPSFVQGPVALVGDAAHTVHPMAGQGLNLGLKDARVLSDTLQKAHDAGMEPTTFLEDYQSDRSREVPLVLGGIHSLHELFGRDDTIMKHAKSVGISVLNQASPLRKQLAKLATGL